MNTKQIAPSPSAEQHARASVGDWIIILWLACVITGALGGLFYATSVPETDGWKALRLGALSGALLPIVGFLISALLIVVPWIKLQITYRLEMWFGNDLNSDAVVGDPGRLMIVQGGTARAKATLLAEEERLNQHISLTEMIQFILACYTVGTSESAQGIKPNDRAKYLEARQVLTDLGLVHWRNSQNKRLGWDIIGTQAAVIKLIREHLQER